MRKRQITDEAFKLFAKQGYGPTTMKQIGQAVGLDKSSLYVHFKSKKDIFSVILAAELQSYTQNVLNEVVMGKTYKEVSHSFINNTLGYFSDHDKLLFWKHLMLMPYSEAYSEISEQVSEVLCQLNVVFTKQLQSKIEDARDPLDKRKKTMSLFILSHGLMDWLVVQKDANNQDKIIAMEVCNTILDAYSHFNYKKR